MTSPSSRMTHQALSTNQMKENFYEREILELMKKEILCLTENSIISSQLFPIFYFLYFLEYGFEAFKRS